MAAIKGKIFATLVLFGVAFLDSDFDPFGSLEDFLNSVLVLMIIFFGDVIWSWIKRR
jgi:predicted CDP-diglyceride synthetase/phosphatidate cytidylyltransferase